MQHVYFWFASKLPILVIECGKRNVSTRGDAYILGSHWGYPLLVLMMPLLKFEVHKWVLLLDHHSLLGYIFFHCWRTGIHIYHFKVTYWGSNVSTWNCTSFKFQVICSFFPYWAAVRMLPLQPFLYHLSVVSGDAVCVREEGRHHGMLY